MNEYTEFFMLKVIIVSVRNREKHKKRDKICLSCIVLQQILGTKRREAENKVPTPQPWKGLRLSRWEFFSVVVREGARVC